jgi:hypothetical protein
MSVQEYNKGHSFRMTGITYRGLCRYLSELPDVVFTRRPRFFWSGEDVGADFTFRGLAFEIETDGWDGALWILAKDKEAHLAEMQELREHIERRCFSGRFLRFLKQRFV